jgi:uroporphyrinogen decarboxylase
VPVLPFGFAHLPIVNGVPIAAIYEDAKASFDAQSRAAELYSQERLNLYGYAMYGGWEFGGEVTLPKTDGDSPTVADYPVKTVEEAERLSLPDDPKAAGSLPISWEFSKLQAEAGCPVTFQANGPLDMAACIAGVENLMTWMIECPDVAHHLFRVCTDFTLEICDIWAAEFGAENLMPFCGYAVESNMLVSPAYFGTFALPYIQETVQHFVDGGVPHCLVHVCGEQTKNLPHYSQVPWPKKSIFSFGIEVPLKTAAGFLADHIIGGHVDPLLVHSGTPEEVLDDSRKSIEEGKDIPAFALMPGCEIPAFSAPVNVYQMTKAARLYGVY